MDGTYVIFVANPVANFGAIGLGAAITGGSNGGNDYLLCYKNNYTVKTLMAGSSNRQSGIYLTPGLWQVQLWISNIEETGSASDAYFFWLDADSGADMDTAERITNSRMYVAARALSPSRACAPPGAAAEPVCKCMCEREVSRVTAIDAACSSNRELAVVSCRNFPTRHDARAPRGSRVTAGASGTELGGGGASAGGACRGRLLDLGSREIEDVRIRQRHRRDHLARRRRGIGAP